MGGGKYSMPITLANQIDSPASTNMRDPTFTNITECQHVAEQAALASSASLASNQVDITPEILDTDLDSLPNFFRGTMPPLPGQSGEPSFAAPRDLIDVWTTGRLDTFDLGNRAGLDFDDIDFCFLDTYDDLMPLCLDFESSTNSCTGLTPMTPYDGGELRDEVQSTNRNDANPKRAILMLSDWRSRPENQSGLGDNARPTPEITCHNTKKRRPHSSSNQHWFAGKLDQSSRDQMLALVVRTSKAADAGQLTRQFPSVDLLNELLRYYLATPHIRCSRWLHMPTFGPINENKPELLLSPISAGAVLTPDGTLRKWGLALQESAREYILEKVRHPITPWDLILTTTVGGG